MKKSILFAFALIATSFTAHAEEISARRILVDAAQVSQKQALDERSSVMVVDHGMSTDVSPRYVVIFNYAGLGEEGNLLASYKITDQPISVNSIKSDKAGSVVISVSEYTGEKMADVEYRVNFASLEKSEMAAREACFKKGDFCDGLLANAKISVERVEK